jgi:murein L,D-transpeptidase YafK
MKNKLHRLLFILTLTAISGHSVMMDQAKAQTISFRDQQRTNIRVKNAYSEKESQLKALLKEKGIEDFNIELFIRVLKKEKQLEVWVCKKGSGQFIKLITYSICRSSGELGPKRQEGDLQVPEGFYYINMFNPLSNFHLSLGINYPNDSDKILGVKGKLGGSIFIHGNCVTIGCIPITDDKIKELYVLCVEAKNAGQSKIPVHIFPSSMSGNAYETLLSDHVQNPNLVNFWVNLKTIWDYFENNKSLPRIGVVTNGSYVIVK